MTVGAVTADTVRIPPAIGMAEAVRIPDLGAAEAIMIPPFEELLRFIGRGSGIGSVGTVPSSGAVSGPPIGPSDPESDAEVSDVFPVSAGGV